MAIQDMVIRTKNTEKHIIKNDIVDKCRKCDNAGESIENVMVDAQQYLIQLTLGDTTKW